MDRANRILLLFTLTFSLLSTRVSQSAPASPAASNPAADISGIPEPAVLPPGPNDSKLAQLTASLLMHFHYLQPKLDDDVSSRFLDRYVNLLDGAHMIFLQSDLQEFEPLRTRLDDLLISGKTEPARLIYARMLQRMTQRVTYVTNFLAHETFDFGLDERINTDRKDALRPATLKEAEALWRKFLKYEVLQERLQYSTNSTVASDLKEKGDDSESKAPTAAAPLKLTEKQETEIAQKVSRRYTRLLHTLREYNADDVLEMYLTALTHVLDPHSDYMGKSQLEDFAIQMKLSLGGIGALLQLDDGYCKIMSLVPEGPAARSKKLHEGDRIVAVAQGEQEAVDVLEETRLTKIVQLIRGPKGTEVRLTIIPADAPDPSARKVVSIVRDTVPLESREAKAKIYEIPQENGSPRRLGVIDLPAFYRDFHLTEKDDGTEAKSTTVDVAKLINKLKEEHVDGIVLDLRRNPGGSLEEAITLTGLFIKDGPVVQVRDPNDKVMVETDDDAGTLYEGPLVVLTSRFSASASEILAGALQDYGRALIVGDTSTHGKGTVQSLINLEPYLKQFARSETDRENAENGGALKVTIRKFYRPSGSSTQKRGVVPDIILPSIDDAMDVGEASLDNPLPFDTIPPQKFNPYHEVQPYLETLRRQSHERIEGDPLFAELADDISRMKKTLNDKTVSLNETERLKEKREAEARAKKRETEQKARPATDEKVWEFSVKEAVLPGLPAPEGTKTNETAKADIPGKAQPAADSDDALDEDHAPAIDLALREAKRILSDYIDLEQKGHALAVTKGGEQPL